MKKALGHMTENGGFTLVEVMVSLAILAVGILGVVSMLATSASGIAQGGKVSAAINLAQHQQDVFKDTAYANIVAMTAADVTSNTNICATGDQSGGGYNLPNIYTRTWTVSEDTTLWLKTITVTVTWTSKGKTHTINLTTKRSKD